MSNYFISNSSNDSIEFGERLGAHLKSNDLILLNGDLGAGKTQITKGIALAFGIKQEISSPTYPILNEYKGGSLPLYHWDFYRLESYDELEDLDFDYLVESGGISVVEWAQRFKDEIVQDFIEFDIEKIDENSRKITLVSTNDRSNQIKDSLFA
ncbi:MAG: tRNA (adenosine(37)-N6)-threonylcarbamoyltransferase complex ATPase subunit type 1 TsaE [Coriobacteriales bacterium]|nr:tRNA (adenosine(37)-N6)-threonylcarbamoyltransferase complex ATPase subunit type 1 TsaE [Coriobacteriales bacterium]